VHYGDIFCVQQLWSCPLFSFVYKIVQHRCHFIGDIGSSWDDAEETRGIWTISCNTGRKISGSGTTDDGKISLQLNFHSRLLVVCHCVNCVNSCFYFAFEYTVVSHQLILKSGKIYLTWMLSLHLSYLLHYVHKLDVHEAFAPSLHTYVTAAFGEGWVRERANLLWLRCQATVVSEPAVSR